MLPQACSSNHQSLTFGCPAPNLWLSWATNLSSPVLNRDVSFHSLFRFKYFNIYYINASDPPPPPPPPPKKKKKKKKKKEHLESRVNFT